MPILDKLNLDLCEAFNKFVDANGGAAMQDLRWGKVKSGWKQEAVYVEQDGKIVGTMMLLLTKMPIVNAYLMYAPRGPICEFDNEGIFESLIAQADEVAQKYKAFVLKMDPELVYDEKVVEDFLSKGYKIQDDVNLVIQPNHNMILRLDRDSIDELMLKIGTKARYYIRSAYKKGVKVRSGRSREDLLEFHKLYSDMATRKDIGCRAIDYFEDMLAAFDEDEVRIFIATYEDVPISAGICLNYGGNCFYIYGASGDYMRNLNASYALNWEMIGWAFETGCETYDFGGVLSLDEKDGLYLFKNRFCKADGVTRYIGEIDKVYRPLVYKLYTDVLPRIKKLRKKLRDRKKKK